MRQLKITKQITNRESVSLDKYLQEVAKEDMINAEEEAILAKRIRQGDTSALDKLTKANLRFVVSVAKQHQNQGVTLPDLINEGNIGLITAAKRFDETRGFKFISYAVWWIRQSIMQCIADQGRIVRLPVNKIGNISKINKVYSELEQLHEREPSVNEIAEILDITPKEVKESLKIAGKHVSVDAPLLKEEGSSTLLDLMESKEVHLKTEGNLMVESLRNEIERSLSSLSHREAQIVKLYYGINCSASHTLEEIGKKLELTRERVRQIKERALRRLKYSSRSELLRPYLG